MELDSALQTFYAEADELLIQMDHALLRVDDGELDDDTLNEIFRAAHTIKGSAGLFGLNHIVNFTHVVENVLDRVRSDQVELDSRLLNVFFKCQGQMEALVKCTEEEFNDNEELKQKGIEILKQLNEWSSSSAADTESQNEDLASQKEQSSKDGCWHISLRLSKDCLRNGMDPISFISYLNTIGEIKFVATIFDSVPTLDHLDPEQLYLAYEIAVKTSESRDTIESTFMFVADDSDITILPPDSQIKEYAKLIESLPEDNNKLGEILVNSGALSWENLEKALNHQVKESKENKVSHKLGDILVEQNKIAKPLVDVALEKQKRAQENSGTPQFVRVDSARLDLLINLIGELVISKQRVDNICQNSKDELLNEAIEGLGNHTEALRDAALDLRMVPIGETFQRFRRIVRDTAQDLGKSIQLTIKGGETELDRLMVEKLTDPLTHIVRNAMDHGIESTDIRKAAGKSETGNLQLSAYHDAGHVVIEVRDDGGGLNKQRIREKAIEKEIINSDDVLPDSELYALIFHPGFSTAEQVTNLSGRGVGMDVVNRNVQALHGSIEVDSNEGQGSKFSIRLPLTLAIIDGFHVQAGGAQFIIPQSTIIECMNLADLEKVEQRHCVNLRGEMIPYVDIRELFSLNLKNSTGKGEQAKHREEMMIVQFGENRAGLVVDDLKGEIQTVVKPLGSIFQALKGIGGSSLLGNGDIAFILDIPQLIDAAVAEELKATNRHK